MEISKVARDDTNVRVLDSKALPDILCPLTEKIGVSDKVRTASREADQLWVDPDCSRSFM